MTDTLPDTIEATLTRAMHYRGGSADLKQGETGAVALSDYLAHEEWFEPVRPKEAMICKGLAGTYQTRQSVLAELDAMPDDQSDRALIETLEEMLEDVRDPDH